MEEDRIVINEDRIELLFKPSKRLLVGTILSIGIGLLIILILFIFSNYENNNVKEPVDYYSIVEKHSQTKDTYVKIRITDIVILEDMYCWIKDEKDNTLIALLSKETINKIIEEYKTKGEEFFYDIEGYIRHDITDWNEAKIQIYLEKNNLISPKENYRQLLEKGVFSEGGSSSSSWIFLFGMLAILFIFSGLVFGLGYWEEIKLIKKSTKMFKCDEIIQELRKKTTKIFEPQNIYLTEEYIVSLQNYLDIIKYQDIFWIYTIKGIENTRLVAATANGEVIIASAYKEERLDRIIEIIKEKNEKILLGYTKENRKKYKEYKRKLK